MCKGFLISEKKKKSDSTKITHKNVPTAEKNAFNTGAKENI